MSGFIRLIFNLKLKTMDEQDYKAMNEESKPQLKQRAIEWLLLNINIAGVSSGTGLNIDEIIEKAKKMEENQIKDAWLSAWKDSMLNPLSDECYQELADEYYNETYEQ